MNQVALPISVKAILWQGKSVLFLKNPRGEWELPGGRPEPGEDERQTVIREVKEECGLDIAAVHPVAARMCEVIPGRWVDIRFFVCDFVGQSLHLSDEHTEARWVSLEENRPPELPSFYWTQRVSIFSNRTAARGDWSAVWSDQSPASLRTQTNSTVAYDGLPGHERVRNQKLNRAGNVVRLANSSYRRFCRITGKSQFLIFR